MKKKLLTREYHNQRMPEETVKKRVEDSDFQLIKYNEKALYEDNEFTQEKFDGFRSDSYRYWLNLHSLDDSSIIEDMCSHLQVQDFIVQDMLDINQRPKNREFENYCFLTLKAFIPSVNSFQSPEQFSFILGENFLVSHQERNVDYFKSIRDKLNNNTGTIRKRGADFLLYLLLESILDNYFVSIRDIEESIGNFGLVDVTTDPSPTVLNEIEENKRQLHLIKKAIVPIKEFVIKVERIESSFIRKEHLKNYLDLKDLCLSLLDYCEHLEVRLESACNMFFSIQGHRMNEIMKILTVISAIFIPLTFIAGVYGMNFEIMPELKWKWGYISVWVFMLIMSTGLIVFFRRKKWF